MIQSAWRDERTTSRRGLMLGGGALALGATGLSGCDTDFTPIRFRETLSFNVDGQIRTGSSVMEFHSWQQHGNIDGNLSGTSIKGQAIIVDLGQGRFVFGGVNSGGPSSVPTLSIPTVSGPDGLEVLGPNRRSIIKLKNGLEVEEWPVLSPATALILKFQANRPTPKPPSAEDAHEQKLDFIRSQRGAKALSIDELPHLITFKNTNDPTTAELIDPRHMERVFGAGVTFNGATIEPVDEHTPITTGITDLIPWIAKNSGERIGPTDLCGREDLCVYGSFFRLGVK